MNDGTPQWPEAFHGVRDRLSRIHARLPMAGAQISASRHGTRLLDASVGEARPGVAMTADSVLYLSCAGKPLLAAVLVRCVDEGMIRFDDAVADHLPAFAAGGKEAVTVSDVLSHAAGFVSFRGHPAHDSYEDFLAHVLGLPLEPGWTPGEDQGYHQETAWYVVAALVESLIGADYRAALARNLCAPLGLSSTWAGLAPETYDAVRHRLAVPTLVRPGGVRSFPYVVTRTGARAKIPSYAYYATMGDLARFYEAALAGLQGAGSFPIAPVTLNAMVSPPRAPIRDRTWGYTCAMGRGFLSGLARHYGFGDTWSDSSFGYSGRVGQVFAGADPATGVVIAAAFGALAVDQATQTGIMSELYEAALACDPP